MQTEDQSPIISSMQQLTKHLVLTEAEQAYNPDNHTTLPLRIPTYFLSLIDPTDPHDPLRRQVVPTVYEQQLQKEELLDPLEEVSHSVTPRLIHRYQSRVAFLTTDICPMYCRHCFRRRFTGTFQGPASPEETRKAAEYVAAHPLVKEILFTGGDVLTLSDKHLQTMLEEFRSRRPDLVIRICTRMPASYPMRITPSLITMLTSFDTAPFYLMTQFNHPRELTPEAQKAVGMFVDAGIPAMNQTVLLREVNDDADTLEALCNKLIMSRIKPYYLFQGDLVSGTAHFRVPLEKGFALEAELRRRVSGLAMPVYAIDLPEGGGKVPLSQQYLLGKTEGGSWMFKTVDGEVRTYPDPVIPEELSASEHPL